jgi:hypothetical protein
VLLIVDDETGVIDSPTTCEFAIATQLKVLGTLAVNTKFNGELEQTAPTLDEVITGKGFTVNENGSFSTIVSPS